MAEQFRRVVTGLNKDRRSIVEIDDWRRSLRAFGQPLFEGETFIENLRKVDALKDVAAFRGMTAAQLALAWVIAEPVVSVALIGTRRPDEIEQNVVAADWDMLQAERDEIRAIVTG